MASKTVHRLKDIGASPITSARYYLHLGLKLGKTINVLDFVILKKGLHRKPAFYFVSGP